MPDFYDSYRSLDADRTLTARVAGSLWWDRFSGLEQLDFLRDRRSAALGRRFRAATVKIMLDGVCETRTASMLTDYLDPSGPATGNTGLRFVDTDALPAIAVALDAAGFQIHLHALGDRAVRDALDALQAAARRQRAVGPAAPHRASAGRASRRRGAVRRLRRHGELPGAVGLRGPGDDGADPAGPGRAASGPGSTRSPSIAAAARAAGAGQRLAGVVTGPARDHPDGRHQNGSGDPDSRPFLRANGWPGRGVDGGHRRRRLRQRSR